MADDGEAIRRLERLASATWPPAEIEMLGGWRLGFTEGVTRRANSVQPNDWTGELALEDAIDRVERHYSDRGLATVFKLTDASRPAELAKALEDRGYRQEGVSDTLVCPMVATGTSGGSGSVRQWVTPDPIWAAVSLAEREPHAVAALTALARRLPEPRIFALLDIDSAPACAGFACLVEGRAAIAGVHTLEAARCRGAARQLVGALMDWAAVAGATMVFLQVERDNPAAQALYRNLGFTRAYGYRYLVKPA